MRRAFPYHEIIMIVLIIDLAGHSCVNSRQGNFIVVFSSLTLGGGNTVVNNVVNNIVAEIDDDLNYVSHETRLLGDLLNGYNKMAIPLYNSSTNVTVTISLIPVNLIELVCIHNSKE